MSSNLIKTWRSSTAFSAADIGEFHRNWWPKPVKFESSIQANKCI